MSILNRKKVLAAKVESTPGTAETLTASEAAMVIREATYSPDIKLFERGILSTSLSNFSRLVGQKAGAIAMKTEVKGGGAAGSAPALGTFLKGAGFLEAISAGVSVTYTPRSSGFQPLTVGQYADDTVGTGLRHLIAGAMARSMRLTANIGEPMALEMEFLGKEQATVDVAPLAPTLEVLAPPVLLAATFTIDSFAAQISQITIDLAPEIALRSDITEATGYDFALMTGRKPTISFDAEQSLVATYDWLGKFKSGNEGALNLVIGASAGNIITITAPKVQYTNISEGDRDGIATFQVEGALNRNSGDDELSIVFT